MRITADFFGVYWREYDLRHIGLVDPKASVLKLDEKEVNLFKLGRMPALASVDKTGMAHFVHFRYEMFGTG